MPPLNGLSRTRRTKRQNAGDSTMARGSPAPENGKRPSKCSVRRGQLLIDRGEDQEAKRLLLSVSFQKVHQRYVRTALWNQICERLNQPGVAVPAELGEDQLASFGAYREFE